VLHWVGFLRWLAALLPLQKRGRFYVCQLVIFLLCRQNRVAHNGLALGAVADFGAQNCQYTTKVDAR